MTSDTTIRDTANTMLKHHGEDAINTVVTKIEEAVRAGDDEASALWLRIAEAIDHLLLYRCGGPAGHPDMVGPGEDLDMVGPGEE